MSSRLNRFPVLALTAAVTLLSLAGCGHSARVRYQDELVKVTERSTINYLNVHASSDTEVLTMWGRDFKDVRGLDPCYLSMTNKHLVLFVTGKSYDGGQATVHLADVSNRTIRDFPAYDSHIGSNIGATKTNRYERVGSVDGDKLTIEAAFLERRYRYVIDLARPQFEREEADFEGALPPHNIEHHVYEAAGFQYQGSSGMTAPKPNKSVQATAAARFRFLALVFFMHPSRRPHPSLAAVPDLGRWADASPCI